MGVEKTVYTFQINDTQAAYQLIMNYLNTHSFKFVDKNGMPRYEYYDYLTAKRFFEFYFQGNQVTICAYLRSVKKPMPIDSGSMAWAVKKAYREQLSPLLDGLSRLSMGANQFADPMQSVAFGQSVVNNANIAFQNKTTNNMETMAIVSFVLAIIGTILCCFGFIYGVAILFIQIWTAIVGMKSRHWPLSVTSLVLCIGTVVYCALVYL